MATHAAQLLEQQLLSTLKSQIVSLTTPLYGTRSEDASKVYDVVAYCMANDIDNTDNDDDEGTGEETTPSYGVAIILYTGPSTSPFTSWTLISHVEHQPDIITGANRLLQDLRRGMGGVVGVCMQSGVWRTEHGRIPNVVPGVGEGGQGGESEAEEDQEDSDGVDEDEQGGGMDSQNDGQAQDSKGGWCPTLASIIEEM